MIFWGKIGLLFVRNYYSVLINDFAAYGPTILIETP